MKSIVNFDNDLSAEGDLQSSQHVKNAKEKKKMLLFDICSELFLSVSPEN